MLNSKKVIVTVKPNGDVSVEAIGYKGQGCKAATKPFEDQLGGAQNVTEKPEMKEQDLNIQTQPQNSLKMGF